MTVVLQSLGKPGCWDSQLLQWQQLQLSCSTVSELLPLTAANAIALKSWVSGPLALKAWHISEILLATGTRNLPWHLCSSLFLPPLIYALTTTATAATTTPPATTALLLPPLLLQPQLPPPLLICSHCFPSYQLSLLY